MKKISLVVLFFASMLLLTGQGCISVQNKAAVGPADGGLWISSDKAETWHQATLLPTVSGVQNIGDLNVNLLIFDPQDPNIIYWGTQNSLFISYDNAQSWQEIKGLPQMPVIDLVIDPKAHNIVYASTGNMIFKSTDCCHGWKDVYLDIPGQAINSIAIDLNNSNRILAGLADGRLVKTEDGGLNWNLLNDFHTRIKKIFFNPKNPRIVYLATSNSGIFRSNDAGATWNKLDELSKINGANNFYYAFFDQTQNDALFVLTDAGFLRSGEGVANWQTYKLLTEPGQVKIQSFTANPKNPNEIYYVTNTTFYKSLNGGVTWITKNLPFSTARLPVYMTTGPQNTNFIYLGTFKQPTKK